MRDLKFSQRFSSRHSVTFQTSSVFTKSLKTFRFNWSLVVPSTRKDLQKKVFNIFFGHFRHVVTSTWIISQLPVGSILPPGSKLCFESFFLPPSGDKHSRRTVPLRHYFAVVRVKFFISWQLHGCWKRGEFQPAEHHMQHAEALRDHDVSF
jgi:hypothetical protein